MGGKREYPHLSQFSTLYRWPEPRVNSKKKTLVKKKNNPQNTTIICCDKKRFIAQKIKSLQQHNACKWHWGKKNMVRKMHCLKIEKRLPNGLLSGLSGGKKIHNMCIKNMKHLKKKEWNSSKAVKKNKKQKRKIPCKNLKQKLKSRRSKRVTKQLCSAVCDKNKKRSKNHNVNTEILQFD